MTWRTDDWQGCYDDGWREIITAESFAHPAKFARGLVERIFKTLLAEGMVKRGDVVVDPFGGIGTGGIIAASHGLQWFGCELEQKFVEMAACNFGLHLRAWQQFGDPQPVLVNGDSRKLRANLAGVLASAVMCSPPYAEQEVPSLKGRGSLANNKKYDTGRPASERDYGDTPGQLGAMPSGSASAVISSPPFVDAQTSSANSKRQKDAGYFAASTNGTLTGRYADVPMDSPGQLGAMPPGLVSVVISSPPYAQCLTGDNSAKETAAESQAKRLTPGGSLGQSARHQGYGGKDNLGNLPSGSVDAVVSSPPYAESVHVGQGGSTVTSKNDPRNAEWTGWQKETAVAVDGYGQSPGQLGNLPAGDVSAIVSSPPYEGSLHENESRETQIARLAKKGNAACIAKMSQSQAGNCGYGDGGGQLGNESGETFWSAALEIVRECYAILKPGSYAVWVVKHFVRDKQLVDFPGDWRKLCEACGFETIREVRAMLVKEKTHPDLFGGKDHVKKTERKSFFRRLAEKKGSPPIDFETVWFHRKPL